MHSAYRHDRRLGRWGPRHGRRWCCYNHRCRRGAERGQFQPVGFELDWVPPHKRRIVREILKKEVFNFLLCDFFFSPTTLRSKVRRPMRWFFESLSWSHTVKSSVLVFLSAVERANLNDSCHSGNPLLVMTFVFCFVTFLSSGSR